MMTDDRLALRPFAHRQGDLRVKQRPAVVFVAVFIYLGQLYVGDMAHLIFAHHGLEHGASPLPLARAAVDAVADSYTHLRSPDGLPACASLLERDMSIIPCFASAW